MTNIAFDSNQSGSSAYLSWGFNYRAFLAKCHCAPDTLSAVISGAHTICAGDARNLLVQFRGPGPYTFSYTDGTNTQSISGITNRYYLLPVAPQLSTTYTLTAFSGQQVSNSFSGQAVVQVTPSTGGLLSGHSDMCNGGTAQLSFQLQGTAPWAVSWSDGTSPFSQTGITQNPFLLSVTPAQSTSYQLLSVTGGTCPGGSVSGVATVQVSAPPTVQLSGAQTICAGQAHSLSFQFTGIPPYALSYSDGSQVFTHTGITQNPYLVSHTPQQSVTYQAVSVSGVCVGSVSGQAVVHVTPINAPLLSADQSICTGRSAMLSLQYPHIPWSFTYSDGTTQFTQTGISTASYTWSVTPGQTTRYTITQVQHQNCSAISLPLETNIHTAFGPAPFIAGPQYLCIGQPAELTVQHAQTPWSFTYSDGSNTASVSGISSTAYRFMVTPGGIETYSILQAESNLCIASPALSTAVLHPRPGPAAHIEGSSSLCLGDTALLRFTYPLTPWTCVWTDGSNTYTQANITGNQFTVPVSPAFTTSYQILSASDGACASDTLGSAQVIIRPQYAAALSGLSEVCTSQSPGVQVQYASPESWSLSWTDGQQVYSQTGITGSPYLLSHTPLANTTYQLLSVSGQCAASALGNALPVRVIAPQARISGQYNICSPQAVPIYFYLQGANQWQLTYSDGQQANTITGITQSPHVLTLTPQASSTYYLVQATGDGCPATLDTAFASVLLGSHQVIALQTTGNICHGDTAWLHLTHTGTLSHLWQVIYSDGQQAYQLNGLSSNPHYIPVLPQQTTTYTLLDASFAGCAANYQQGQGIITVRNRPLGIMSGSSGLAPTPFAQLSVSLTGAWPWRISYTDGSVVYQDSGITQQPSVYSVYPQTSTTYTLLSVHDRFCPGSAIGQVVLPGMPVGIASEITTAGIRVYPNPADAFIIISLSGVEVPENAIRIYDALGRIMQLPIQATADGYRLDVSSLPKGMYVLQVGDHAWHWVVG